MGEDRSWRVALVPNRLYLAAPLLRNYRGEDPSDVQAFLLTSILIVLTSLSKGYSARTSRLAIQQAGIEPIVNRLADFDFFEIRMLGI
jgi:hypothetical protein